MGYSRLIALPPLYDRGFSLDRDFPCLGNFSKNVIVFTVDFLGPAKFALCGFLHPKTPPSRHVLKFVGAGKTRKNKQTGNNAEKGLYTFTHNDYLNKEGGGKPFLPFWQVISGKVRLG